jgi:hypothetical protein
MRLIIIGGTTAFLALFFLSSRGEVIQENGTAGLGEAPNGPVVTQMAAGGLQLGSLGTNAVGPGQVEAGQVNTVEAAVIRSSSINFGPAPELVNGGAPNPASEIMRDRLSTPAHGLVAEISPRWARAIQVSAANEENAAHEFAVGILEQFSQMAVEIGLSIESVEQLHLSGSEHFEETLGGTVGILSDVTN